MNAAIKKFLSSAVIAAALFAPFALFSQGLDTGSVNKESTTSYIGTANQNLYDISFKDASLREVLEFLSWIGGMNIMVPEGIDANVTVNFRSVTISDAMNTIIKANDLEYTLEGGVIRVGKGAEFKESGEDLKSETFRLRFAPSGEMKDKIKTLLSGRGSAVADERTNSLIVREIPSNLENVRRFVDDVDIKDAQVLIESKILEATRSFSRSLGIQWGATKNSGTQAIRFGGVAAVGQADSGRSLNVNLPGAASPTSGLFMGSFFKGVNLDIQILAAERRGDVYVISDPSIVTSNGRAAKIRSGATLLIQSTGNVTIGATTGTTAQTGTNLQEIETGVELNVTPQITIDDFIKLDINTTTSTPDFSRAIQGIPIVVDNTATTTVLVKDGETTVIGGLSRFSDSLNKRDVPYISKVPLFGNLFKSKERTKENTELLVFIKPTVIRTEGMEPAQMRLRDLEERKETISLEPIENPEKVLEKEAKKGQRLSAKKRSKYRQ